MRKNHRILSLDPLARPRAQSVVLSESAVRDALASAQVIVPRTVGPSRRLEHARGFTSRPGPRLCDGAETPARSLHPSPPGRPLAATWLASAPGPLSFPE